MAGSGRSRWLNPGYELWQNVDRSGAGFGLKGGAMQMCVGLLTHDDPASLFLPSLKGGVRADAKHAGTPVK
jgi:hypothetical protein